MADPNKELRDLITALANNVQTLTTTVTNFINAAPTAGAGAAGAAAGGGGGAPPAPTAVVYAPSPGTAKVDDLLDYTTKYGVVIYKQGRAALYEKEEDKFDLDNDKVTSFTREINERAESMGWNSPNQGILTYVVNGSNVNIIDDYGRIEMNEIPTQSEPFYLSTGAKHDKRAAQNNAMFYDMLKNLLTKSAKDQVAVYKDEYLLDDGTGKKIVLAPAYYKIIMRLTTLDTKLTNRALRNDIKELPTYALTVNGDIDLIHKKFNDTYAMLKARGEDIENKEEILFETYANVPDYAVFRNYMFEKQTAYLQ
jgi:hypothetical protein